MIRVTTVDTATGDTDTVELGDDPDGWVLVTGPGCELWRTQRYTGGVFVLTVRPTPGET